MIDQVGYEEKAATTFPAQPATTAQTIGVSVGLSYEKAKPFLSGRPLRRPKRRWPSKQVDAQAEEAMRRLADPSEKPIPFDSVREQLDLD